MLSRVDCMHEQTVIRSLVVVCIPDSSVTYYYTILIVSKLTNAQIQFVSMSLCTIEFIL